MKNNIKQLIENLLKGETQAAARLITLIENSDKKEKIIKAISPNLGKAYTIGVTGAPGVGKSTLTDKLVRLLLKKDKKIGVIAIDPTSPFSGGAILGDRIRLQQLSAEKNVFIRSMATRGYLGGISSSTADTIKVLDAFGCDYIFVETVGVGQSEVEIVKNVDTNLLVMIPGMGDEIQALKAGIMEIADIFVINKADKDGVERTILEIEMLQNLDSEKDFIAPVQKVIARDNIGIENLWHKILKHKDYLFKTGKFESNRKKRMELELKHIINNKLLKQTKKILEKNLEDKINRIYKEKKDLYSVANKILKKFL